MIRLLADPDLIPLADALINDDAQRLWLLQLTAEYWGMDAGDPQGIAVRSILPQFFGSADQPDALAAIRGWTASLFSSLHEQDQLVDSGALGALEVPVSIIFGESDHYLDPSLAREIAGLFTASSLYLVQDASHWPQHDQPQVVADLLAEIASTQSQR
jgi:pimeloyl-ACP methyl ester carboxylesterase